MLSIPSLRYFTLQTMLTRYLMSILLLSTLFTSTAAAQPEGWPWRGLTYSTERLQSEGLDILGDVKAFGNMARIHVNLRNQKKTSGKTAKAIMVENLDLIDRALIKAKELGITTVISISFFPIDGTDECDDKFNPGYWENSKCIRGIYDTVEAVTRRYRGFGSELGAYQFMAEPSERKAGRGFKRPANWFKIMRKIISIRDKNDPNRYLLVTPGPGGSPKGYRNFKKPQGKRIIYNAHMYLPHKYSHQGVKKKFPAGVNYPGKVGGRQWNENALRKKFDHLRAFQQRHGVPVMIGEFNASNWAPGRERYLTDLINLFEEYGFGWAHFGYVTPKGMNINYEQAGPGKLKRIGKSADTWGIIKKALGK